MIEAIEISQRDYWDSIVACFNDIDVYYLSGYVMAFHLHGDGDPVLLHYKNGDCRGICVMMKRDISKDPSLERVGLPENVYFDMITPYGYGGFHFNEELRNNDVIYQFNLELADFLADTGCVSAFFRFHPVFANAYLHRDSIHVVELGETISMDLDSPEIIWDNITSKNRNVIRKAEKNGVMIRHGRGPELMSQFREIYNETMMRDNAEPYYYFEPGFYDSISRDLASNHELFYAVYNGLVIAMAIIIFAGKRMNYHLSGSKYEFRHLAPSNLLLYKAALWGYDNGFKTFHLGGGVGSGMDNLYRFKAAFNRSSSHTFSIGSIVLDKETYDMLVSKREFTPAEQSRITYFPAYRALIPDNALME